MKRTEPSGSEEKKRPFGNTAAGHAPLGSDPGVSVPALNLHAVLQDLANLRQQYVNLYDSAAAGYFTFDADGRIKDVNLTGADLLGSRKDHLLNKPFPLFIHDQDAEIFRNHVAAVAGSGRRDTIEIRIRKADGTAVHAEFRSTGVDDDGKALCLSVATDVTDRVRFERLFRESEERYRALAESLPEAILVQQSGCCMYANPAALELLGVKAEEIFGKPALNHIHPEFRHLVLQLLAEVEEQGRKIPPRKLKILKTGGEAFDAEVVFAAVTFTGAPAVQIVIRDAAARPIAGQAPGFQADILAQVNDAVIVTDAEGLIKYWNYGAEKLYEYRAADALGRQIDDLIPHRWNDPLDERAASEALATTGAWRGETIQTTRSGRELFVESSISMLRDDANRPAGLLAVIHNITERKRLEQELRQSEADFRAMFEVSAVGKIQVHAVTKQFIRVNKKFCDMIGYAPDELIAMTFMEITHPDDRDREHEIYAQALAHETDGWKIEKRYIRKDGSIIWVKVTGSILFDAAGNPLRSNAVVEDITESKHAEQALRESEERYRSLVESSPEAIFVHQGGVVVYMNPAGLVLFGANRLDDVRGKDVLQLVHPDFRHIVLERILTLRKAGGQVPSYDLKILRLDGQWVDGESIATEISYGGRPAIQVIVKNISDRKETELQLRLQATVLSQVHDAVVAIGKDGRIIFWNKAAERMYRLSALEAIGRHREEVYRYHWLSAEDEDAAKQAMAATGFLRGENIHILRNGEKIYVGSSVSVLLDWSGAPAGWLAVMRDITERKTFERKLAESEERYRSLVESSPDAIFVSQAGRIIFANPASMKLLRLPDRDRIIGTDSLAVIHPDLRRQAAERLRQAEEGCISAPSHESVVMRSDGTAVDVEAVIIPITFDGRPAAQIIVKDITERKEFEEALRNSERLYRMMFESNPNPMWIYDTDTLRFLFVNDSAVTRYGYSREEFLEMTIRDIRPAEHFSVLLDNVAKIAAGLHDAGNWQHRKKDGTIIDVEIMSHGLKVDGKNARVVLAHDVTARRKAEAALRESQQAYRTLAENLPGIVYRVFTRENNRIQFFNKTAAAITGYRDDELAGGAFCCLDELIVPEDQPGVVAAVKKAVEEKRSFTVEYRLRHRNGDIRFLLEQGSPIFDLRGNLLYIDGVISDITERKDAERALRESEERQRAVFDNLPMGVFVKDLQGRFMLTNHQFEQWMGIERKDFTGKADHDLFPPEVAEVCLAGDRKVVDAGAPVETEEVILHGGQEHVHLTIKFLLFDEKDKPYALCGISADITERKRAEQSIKEARDTALLERNRLEAVLNTIPSAVFVEDLAGAVLLQNRQVREIIGRRMPDRMTAAGRIEHFGLRKPDGSLFRPDEMPTAITLRTGGTVRDIEMSMGKPGSRDMMTLLVNATPLVDQAGTVIASVVAFTDITERKRAVDELKRARAELELRVKERTAELAATIEALQDEIAERKRTAAERDKLVAAVESTAEAILVTDSAGIIQYVNPAFEQITGFRREEAIGNNVHLFDSGEHDEDFFQRMRDTIHREGVWKGRMTNRKKDGTTYYEDCTYSPVRNRSGEIVNYVSIKHDVTEKLRLEAIAETVDAMNNIGYVFSGIRHEIGNPVSSLLIIMNLLKKRYQTSPKETIGEYVDQAISQLERIEYLLTTLKNFNMYENLQVRATGMLSFLEKFAPLVSSDLKKKGITFEIQAGAGEFGVLADPRALQQALLNIVVNASDALAERPGPKIVLAAERTGSMVRVRVSDNGAGIPEERKKDLFKPFYTTKAHGTGLGLVITRKLISRMKGFIEIASHKDKGTVVDIYLPEGSIER